MANDFLQYTVRTNIPDVIKWGKGREIKMLRDTKDLINSASRVAERKARSSSPVDTGTLERSIKQTSKAEIRLLRSVIEVRKVTNPKSGESTKVYGIFQERGTRRFKGSRYMLQGKIEASKHIDAGFRRIL